MRTRPGPRADVLRVARTIFSIGLSVAQRFHDRLHGQGGTPCHRSRVHVLAGLDVELARTGETPQRRRVRERLIARDTNLEPQLPHGLGALRGHPCGHDRLDRPSSAPAASAETEIAQGAPGGRGVGSGVRVRAPRAPGTAGVVRLLPHLLAPHLGPRHATAEPSGISRRAAHGRRGASSGASVGPPLPGRRIGLPIQGQEQGARRRRATRARELARQPPRLLATVLVSQPSEQNHDEAAQEESYFELMLPSRQHQLLQPEIGYHCSSRSRSRSRSRPLPKRQRRRRTVRDPRRRRGAPRHVAPRRQTALPACDRRLATALPRDRPGEVRRGRDLRRPRGPALRFWSAAGRCCGFRRGQCGRG
mmetsp:Transcript_77684/g.218019  ORF Transcript_77684/g.218019 Transcript_77684/m.218019 type:complete len:363 (-) Transcript_77684:518-1606(-)